MGALPYLCIQSDNCGANNNTAQKLRLRLQELPANGMEVLRELFNRCPPHC